MKNGKNIAKMKKAKMRIWKKGKTKSGDPPKSITVW